jgi:hypothetical protein
LDAAGAAYIIGLSSSEGEASRNSGSGSRSSGPGGNGDGAGGSAIMGLGRYADLSRITESLLPHGLRKAAGCLPPLALA